MGINPLGIPRTFSCLPSRDSTALEVGEFGAPQTAHARAKGIDPSVPWRILHSSLPWVGHSRIEFVCVCPIGIIAQLTAGNSAKWRSAHRRASPWCDAARGGRGHRRTPRPLVSRHGHGAAVGYGAGCGTVAERPRPSWPRTRLAYCCCRRGRCSSSGPAYSRASCGTGAVVR